MTIVPKHVQQITSKIRNIMNCAFLVLIEFVSHMTFLFPETGEHKGPADTTFPTFSSPWSSAYLRILLPLEGIT
jgi:hypothetical protein